MSDKVTVKGEVISIKPKYDRVDPDSQGITVKPKGGVIAYWFKWSPTRGELTRGSIVELTGEKTPKQPNSNTFVWLHKVKVIGKTCPHTVIIRDAKVYSCEGCGAGATVSLKKGA